MEISNNVIDFKNLTCTSVVVMLLAAGTWLFVSTPAGAESTHSQGQQAMKMGSAKVLAPYAGYLKAHKGVQHPLQLLGGPLEV